MKKYITLSFFLILLLVINLQVVQANEHIRTVLNKVVMIIAMDENYQPLGIGSGFVIGQHGEIATNYHVIEGASSAIVKFVNKEEKYKAISILQKNSKYDLAIIQINAKTTPLLFGDDELTSIGDQILAIGNPEGLEGTVSEGIISGFRKVDENFRLMQITAPISPGSSGGPVINQNGQVIGVASASLILGQNLNFAIPVKNLKKLKSAPKLNLLFSKLNLPVTRDQSLSKQTKDTDLVQAFSIKVETKWQGGSANVSFSIKNNSRRDIKNIKLLILWKSKAGEILHFSPILVEDIIPSLLAKSIQKKYLEGVGNIPYSFEAEARIIDYEILQSSGFMEFK